MKDKLKTFLENHIEARERRYRERHLVDFILENGEYKFPLTKSRLIDFVHDFASADRYWRMTLKERKDLRGKDYDTKDIVEQQKEIELGFSPNHYKDVATLKRLS